MDWTLELIVVPVSDVDRAKAFYIDQMGFGLDVDHDDGPGLPGRAADAARLGLLDRDRDRDRPMEPGHAPRTAPRASTTSRPPIAELVERGVDASEPFHFGEAGQATGRRSRAPELRDVRDSPRPGRQHLARPGSQARLGLEQVKRDEVAA